MMKKGIPLVIVILVLLTPTYGLAVSNRISNDPVSTDGLMDSPWPMLGHDTRHTGRSTHSTENNTGTIKWIYKETQGFDGGPVIDNDGNIYICCFNGDFLAFNPDGTLKWEKEVKGAVQGTPAIAEDGTLYIGTYEEYLYALNPNGTVKWRLELEDSIKSSPAIAEDGTIYFGLIGPGDIGRFYAVNPNGTVKWHYDTGNRIYASPAIADDGTVYISSSDKTIYAFYPNGIVRWTFHKGNYLSGVAIGDDGTIYSSCWNGYLYAINPDGSEKWACNIGMGSGLNPSVGIDGTIYIGTDDFYAIYPDGTEKWRYDIGKDWDASSLTNAISSDDTIYFGAVYNGMEGADIVALYPDGTEKWRVTVGNHWAHSPPCIGSDGTVYIGGTSHTDGAVYAIGGPLDPDAPYPPTIDGPIWGKAGKAHDYTFTTESPLGRDVYYYVEWGDGKKTDWIGPYASGEPAILNHTWEKWGIYTIKARAKDSDNLWGDWGELKICMPVSQTFDAFPLLRILSEILNRFPNLFQLFQILGE